MAVVPKTSQKELVKNAPNIVQKQINFSTTPSVPAVTTRTQQRITSVPTVRLFTKAGLVDTTLWWLVLTVLTTDGRRAMVTLAQLRALHHHRVQILNAIQNETGNQQEPTCRTAHPNTTSTKHVLTRPCLYGRKSAALSARIPTLLN